LAGTRNTYSNYCAALAASGNVVLAIEHRDGSGPAVLNPTEDGKGELMTYLSMEDLTYVPSPHIKKGADNSWSNGEGSKDKLRSLQLDMRLQEVYETYNSFKRLVSDPSEQGRTKFDEKATPESITRVMASLPNSIDFENVHLTGHSFGGGTMVSPPSCLLS
jgi:platelet-activating factor acetylhydrolase